MSKHIGNCASCKIRHSWVMNFIEFCPLHKAAPELLDELKNLVRINEEWNTAVIKIIGRTPGWNESYLDIAKAIITKAEARDGQG